MSIALYLKNNLKNPPAAFGKLINYLPFQYRPGIGPIYSKRKNELLNLEKFSVEQQQKFVFERIKKLVDYSYENIVFYKKFYDEKKFSPVDLQSFKDISAIPITSKSILSDYEVELRSSKIKNRYLVNTGGSSGTPFALYIQPDSMGHEWAHMHTIWSKLDYKPSNFKLVFGGRADMKDIVGYDVVRNQFTVNTYAPNSKIADALNQIVKKYRIDYLHGYPSLIYDFAKFCEEDKPAFYNVLKRTLKGAFLGSEYPHKIYRDYFEKVFEISSVSWYGHTERAILAYEKEHYFTYCPFLSYGFAEIVENNDAFELIGTSYYNYASPLIRYTTNDIVSNPIYNGGILKSFEIFKGRDGDFVIDKSGKRISLTALIFGRHHTLFNKAKYLQVKQPVDGSIEIHYVGDVEPQVASEMFDQQFLDFDISFIKNDQPVRTKMGKLNLLIK